MGWLTSGKQGEAERLISQLSDVTKRDRAAQDLVRLGTDAVNPHLETLQTKDGSLLPLYQQILARIPSATPTMINLLGNAHPDLLAAVFAISRDCAAVPGLLDAVQGELPYASFFCARF